MYGRNFVLLVVLLASAALALAQPARVALVVGNAAYGGGAELRNPVNDASDIAEALEAIGWDVTVVSDADRRTFNRAVTAFRDRLAAAPGADALFYYAGHAMQVDGANYLIPVGSDFETVDDVRADAVDLADLTEAVSRAGAGVSVMILDACRDNPFASRMTRSLGGTRGLTVVGSGGGASGSAIMFSTAPGETAMDGSGRNGVFTSALLHYLDGDLKLEDLFRGVISDVSRVSGGAQKPWINASLTGDFYFVSEEIRQARASAAAQAEAAARQAEIDRAVAAARAEESVKAAQAEAEAVAARQEAAAALEAKAQAEAVAKAATDEAALRTAQAEARAAEARAAEALARAAVADQNAAAALVAGTVPGAALAAGSGQALPPNAPGALWVRLTAGQEGTVVVELIPEDGSEPLLFDSNALWPVTIPAGSYTAAAMLTGDEQPAWESEALFLPGGTIVLELPLIDWSPYHQRQARLTELNASYSRLSRRLTGAADRATISRVSGWVLVGLGTVSAVFGGLGYLDSVTGYEEYLNATTPPAAAAVRARAVEADYQFKIGIGSALLLGSFSLPFLFSDGGAARTSRSLAAVQAEITELEAQE